MTCYFNYTWTKVPKELIPYGKGVLSDYLHLIAAAAARDGEMRYCGHLNKVRRGEWSGGVVGLKAILDTRSTKAALAALDRVREAGLAEYSYAGSGTLLTYRILKYPEMNYPNSKAVTYDSKSGFLSIPRDLADPFAEKKYVFEEGDAWTDLWLHTVVNDTVNVFSFIMPVIQFEAALPTMKLDRLADRWSWSKAKVQRFFVKNTGTFRLYKLPGSYGCVLFNTRYGGDHRGIDPAADISDVCSYMRQFGSNDRNEKPDRDHFCSLVYEYSSELIRKLGDKDEGSVSCPEIRKNLYSSNADPAKKPKSANTKATAIHVENVLPDVEHTVDLDKWDASFFFDDSF